ncbi:adenosylcobinamide-phosphate synthase [Amycolatopsis bartoniae]|uniref:Cobalamin biosynthesis protein CobD n=1 Tax=Amycolatopsis bartoniae TaxID=941986 RepID=A0A8H9J2U4_9PSEU|nr:cobalamin biosynthesis protein [Amycolatopsis bartoniae]MBB2938845.1 adenosylcobinamide-phosphate synthase [Amycolatopsis bartoniae]TVS99637.1 cobalamin biosynthesis protein [Amycolatopsis bartoniae]GHF89357.1 cobalamin biosynthesis protein CobD [Amycolatopsis bartoniae]
MSAARAIGLLLGAAADGVIGRGEPLAAFCGALEGKRPAYTAGLVGGLVVAGIAVERATRRSPVLQAAGTAVATWAVLGGAGLAADGTSLARDLEDGELDSARDTLSGLDARTTKSLDVIGLSRASVESVAQHTSDSVVAPMFWGAVAGIPGLLVSRVLSVLRGTRFAARLDELVNLVPTRVAAALTVTGAPVVGGSASGAWRAWRRDTTAHPSPNAGRIEAAFAGALEIRLGGRTVYPDGVAELPVLGDGRNPDAGHVTRAVELSRVVGLLTAVSSAVLALLTGLRRSR